MSNAIYIALFSAVISLCAGQSVNAQSQNTLHITHQYANTDARSMIGLPMGNHKTIVTKDGQLMWSQWSLAQKGRAVLFGFSEQFDGALGIQMAEMQGTAAKPLAATTQHLDGMRFPFVVTNWQGDALSAEETAFAVSAEAHDLDVLQVTVSNRGAEARTLSLKLSGKQRNLPAFADGSQLATRDGKLLALVEPSSGVARQSAEGDGLVVAQQREVPAHGSITFWIKLPYELPQAEENSLTHADGPALLSKARQDWETLWSQGTQIQLPSGEKELSDFYQASVASILMLTERDEKGEALDAGWTGNLSRVLGTRRIFPGSIH